MCKPCKSKEPATYTVEPWTNVTDEIILSIMLDQVARGDTHPTSLKINALLIREYGAPAIKVIRAKREEHRQWVASTMDNWRTKVSRRPQRGNHYDSWKAREKYCRLTMGSAVSYA